MPLTPGKCRAAACSRGRGTAPATQPSVSLRHADKRRPYRVKYRPIVLPPLLVPSYDPAATLSNPGRRSGRLLPLFRMRPLRAPFASRSLFLLLFLAASLPALEPARLFTDHMVLQRDLPVPVWGTAEPESTITVTFADQTHRTTPDPSGHWRITLAPLPTSSIGRDLLITAQNPKSKIQNQKFKGVVVGEVWFCAGQSNMEKPVGPRSGQKPTELHELVIATAHEPRLRFFNVPRSDQKQDHPAKLQIGRAHV